MHKRNIQILFCGSAKTLKQGTAQAELLLVNMLFSVAYAIHALRLYVPLRLQGLYRNTILNNNL